MIEFGEPIHVYGMVFMIFVLGVMIGCVVTSALAK